VSELESKVGEVLNKAVIEEMKLEEEVKRLDDKLNEALSSAAAVELGVREMTVSWPTPLEGAKCDTSSKSKQEPDSVRGEENIKRNVGFAEKFKNKPKDTVLVVGSSMARGVGSCLERDSNLCTKMDYGGAWIEGIQQKLAEIGEKPQSHLVLMVGTNNLKSEGTSLIMKRYRELISEAKKHKYRKISVVGILRSDVGDYINSKRIRVNLRLEELCHENDVGYIEGSIGNEHLDSGGLHLNDEGQEEVAMAIFRHCNLYLN